MAHPAGQKGSRRGSVKGSGKKSGGKSPASSGKGGSKKKKDKKGPPKSPRPAAVAVAMAATGVSESPSKSTRHRRGSPAPVKREHDRRGGNAPVRGVHGAAVPTMASAKATAGSTRSSPLPARRRSLEIRSRKMSGTHGIPRTWLLDTGCPYDLVGRNRLTAQDRRMCRPAEKRVKLETANGIISCAEVATKQVGPLTEAVDCLLLDSSPAVLSIGRRCQLEGYQFVWKPFSSSPYLIHPSTKQRIELTSINYCPYLCISV